ncbi:hypothetical protein ABH923_000837 [Leifsonia sp. EB41]|uniref:hypothetical protein n=1 Tax=Leifsonia sp. EB41 TaxID=3156260 RepID=UPI0035168D67
MSNRGILSAVYAAVSAIALVVLLSGCSAGLAPADATVSSVPTATTLTATTPPVVESSPAPQPLDAQSAWNACAETARENYVAQNPGSSINPFEPAKDQLTTAGDGSVIMIVSVKPPQPIEGVGSIVVICTMAGTADAPVVVEWTMKDV